MLLYESNHPFIFKRLYNQSTYHQHQAILSFNALVTAWDIVQIYKKKIKASNSKEALLTK